MIYTLVELGHPQSGLGTPIETDNSTAHDILTAQVHMNILAYTKMEMNHQP